MRGFPSTLSTKEDYIYVKENFPKEQWQPYWQSLLDTMYDWFFVSVLEQGDEGVTDDTHKVVIDEKTGTKSQYQYSVNINCKLLRLGFSKEEVEAALNE